MTTADIKVETAFLMTTMTHGQKVQFYYKYIHNIIIYYIVIVRNTYDAISFQFSVYTLFMI